MAFNPLKHAFDDDGKPTPALNGFLDNALKVQRPVVLRWVKRLRAEHPTATMLSAGMSGDLEQAVAHGATHLRVGTAILGSRPPHG